MRGLFFILIVCLLTSCNNQPTPNELKQLLESFEKDLHQAFPDFATATGQNQTDDVLVIMTRSQISSNIDFCVNYINAFDNFDDFQDHPKLNKKRIEKLEILSALLSNLESKNGPMDNPAYYDVYGAISYRLQQIEHKEINNLDLLEKTLDKIPRYYEEAKYNLINPNLINTRRALEQQKETFVLLRNKTTETLTKWESDPKKDACIEARDRAVLAIKDYWNFCNSLSFELQQLEKE